MFDENIMLFDEHKVQKFDLTGMPNEYHSFF